MSSRLISRNYLNIGVLLLWNSFCTQKYPHIWAGEFVFHTFPVQMWNKIPWIYLKNSCRLSQKLLTTYIYVINSFYIKFMSKCKLQWHWAGFLVVQISSLRRISYIDMYANEWLTNLWASTKYEKLLTCAKYQMWSGQPISPIKWVFELACLKYCAAVSHFMLWYVYQCYHGTACKFWVTPYANCACAAPRT